MNFIIQTPSATRLKKEILDSVSAGADANGKSIDTWKCTETEEGDKVLVHTLDQWSEKGRIALRPDFIRSNVQVRFFYWDSWKERELADDKIMLGRFTELILVHFSYLIDKITIE